MKRDPRLVEFSREHHSALKLGLLIKNSNDLALLRTEIKKSKGALLNHFAEEETDLLGIMNCIGAQSVTDRFEDEHRTLRRFLHQKEYSLEEVKAFGDLLTSHTRFEEQELFEAIQDYWIETDSE